jgi:hypothetical protein
MNILTGRPFHWLIFRGLTRDIAARASVAEASAGVTGQDV